MSFTVIAVIKVKNEFVDDFLRELDIVIRNSQTEPGCITYIAHQNSENKNSIFIYEKYKDEPAYFKHKSSAHLANFGSLIGHMLSSTTVVYRGRELILGR